MRHEDIIALCEFGSQVRGQSDSLSDRDLLVVVEDFAKAKSTINRLEAEGWAISLYSKGRLESLRRKKSLFLQHIKLEGKVVFDPTGFLGNLLSDFEPKANYKEELEDSITLLLPACRRPSNDAHLHFVSDVLYVFLRNALIYKFASKGSYEFGYSNLIELISAHEMLDKAQIANLTNLRLVKSAYRSRKFVRVSVEDVVSTMNLIADIFGITLLPIAEKTPARILQQPYATLRDIEGLILSYYSVTDLDNENVANTIISVWRKIVAPFRYSFFLRKLDAFDVSEINRALLLNGADAA